MVQMILVGSGYRGGPKLSGMWPWSDLGRGGYWLSVQEYDKGSVGSRFVGKKERRKERKRSHSVMADSL